MNLPTEPAVDQLWKHQLRREHAALLQEIKDQKDKFTALVEESTASHERLLENMTNIKSKLEKFANEGEKRAQEFKDDLKTVQEKAVESEKIRVELKTLAVRVDALERTGDRVSEPTVLSIKHATQEPAVAVAKPSKPTNTRRISTRSTGNVNIKPLQNVANTGLRKSRRQARQEPSPVASREYVKLSDELLNQDNLSLEQFVLQVDEISVLISPEEQKELAGMFITGLHQREDQDRIVEELGKKDLVRDHGEGQVEIRCVWKDIKKVLRISGLTNEVQDTRTSKKRKK